MSDSVKATLVARRIHADESPGYLPPQSVAAGDAGGALFRSQATLDVPRLTYLFEQPLSEGAYTHFLVDVWSPFFSAHHDWQFEVSASLDGVPVERHLFHTWYGRHQFFFPIGAFRKDSQRIVLRARPLRAGTGAAQDVVFEMSTWLTSKPRIWSALERQAVWVFSTARSGSTWLTNDVICSRWARPVDESGVGRMFAPLQMDAERFYDPAARSAYIQSGSDFEFQKIQRASSDLPVFERAFSRMTLENQILSELNFEFYHRMLRDVALEHVINEWGLIGYSRLAFKMPNDSTGADFVMRAFPKSHMVFLMRDGRDVMRSRFSPFASQQLADTSDLQLRRHAIAHYSHFWNFQIDIIRSAFDAHDPRKRILVRYEDMRRDTLNVVRGLLAHLEMPATEEQLLEVARSSLLENMPAEQRGPDKPRQSGLIGGFRSTFSEDEIVLMNSIMGENLRRFGYLA